MTVITLTTDFGTDSPYVAAMKGSLLSINPAVKLIDITHAIPPQDVRHGAMVLAETCNRFPDETIHVIVVDPGVGTERGIIYTHIGRHHYIAPDNGLLSLLATQTPPGRIIRLTKSEYWLAEVSSTFHGRDIMAPAAAQLSLGLDPKHLGVRQESMVMLDWPGVHIDTDTIRGEVLHVDSFGNLITNITAEMLTDHRPDAFPRVTFQGQDLAEIRHTYGESEPGSLIALIGSTGRLEIAVVNGNAAKRLRITGGEPVDVLWQNENT